MFEACEAYFGLNMRRCHNDLLDFACLCLFGNTKYHEDSVKILHAELNISSAYHTFFVNIRETVTENSKPKGYKNREASCLFSVTHTVELTAVCLSDLLARINH